MVELLEVAELWLWSGLVDAAPALLVDGEFCAELVDGLVRSTEDAEDELWSVFPAAFEVGGGVVVVDWLFVGLALLGAAGIELLGEVAAGPVALWSEDVLELVVLLQESEIMLTELTCMLLLSVCVPFTST
jgi:hypothetical protein